MTSSARILLVDNDAAFAQSLRRALTAETAHGLRHAASLDQAAQALDADAFDVVLLNISWPGVDALGWFVEQKDRRDLPAVVALISTADESLGLTAIGAGVQDYLVRSDIDAGTLARTVRHAVERERVHRQLVRTGRRFRQLIENALDIIAIVDSHGVIVYDSPSTERILGTRPEDLVGKSLWELVHPDDEGALRQTMADLFSGTGLVHTAEFRMQHADGSWHTFDCAARSLLDGSTPQIVLNASDVTDRKQAEAALQEREAQLRQSQKMEAIGRVAGSVAHDFSNLLMVIVGASEHLLERLRPGDPLLVEAEAVRKNADRAVAMTRQLLAFSRQQVFAPVVLNLNDILVGTEPLLRRLIGENIELRTTCAHDLGSVSADQTQIEQVLLNLAINARDAMPDGGQLTMATGNIEFRYAQGLAVEPGRYVRIVVSDTGTGMDAATHARAFEPFFTTKEGSKGTGLGLATVYGIVKQSGGVVDIESAPGKGTRVTVHLPRVDDLSNMLWENPAASSAVSAAGGIETLLLVEDEDGVRELVRDMLEGAGYRVLDADHPVTADRLCREFQGHIDLLLTDVVMPEMSGRDLARLVLKARPETRVLFMSGYPEHISASGGVRAPGTHFIAKPFERQMLLRSVRQALDEAP